MLVSRLHTQNPIRWENYQSSVSERTNRLRRIETKGKTEWVGRWFVQGIYPRGRGLSKWPIVTRPCYQLAIIPTCIQEGKQNVFEWLYGRLGNSRFRGCMYWDVVQPPFGCTWNPMWVAYEHTEPRSTDSVSLPPDCTYVIRVRYANDSAFERAALKVGFKSAISQHRYYF